jgi:hypothetical protein
VFLKDFRVILKKLKAWPKSTNVNPLTLWSILSTFQLFKIAQKSVNNTPNVVKNAFKWLALIFEVFFKS